MPKDSMTPKERWTAVLQREKPDRVPLFWSSTQETLNNTKKYLGVSENSELFKVLHIDEIISVFPDYIGPEFPEGTDFFGCGFKEVSYGTGVYTECVYHPLAQFESIEEIKKNYKFPSIDWFDFSGIKKQICGKEHLPLYGGGMEIFLRYRQLRGFERAMIDIIEKPEMVEYCLDNIFHLYYRITEGIYEEIPGKVLLTMVAEDLGSQESLLFSPECIGKLFLPRMRKMMKLVHENNARVITHSDGAIRDIILDLIDCGMDVLNPVQWRCKGMERGSLKRDFGDKICFHGAMDNQYTMPFGSVDDVKKEVMDNIRILGDGGGFFLGPCHNLQAITPVENIIAMYETGYEYGWY
ncbi:MAG TPA: uroporphyrinogen decarboxylase family protein [Candidatus Ratteibacteria bacterium]|uniref:Methylcobalamin:coenzyme M methyltransferase n=1 Tax=candidate division TA06 bacterium ADurb.Bin131 TaxID=1852827 RepID=A0A1V6CBY8_UNCT6|nr:MAG: methylcobalamin:coenzyme M methyltransferase [candidate division TA06 bacterium ADurb.Bin131]HOC01886.1 uroporphyrinogen decarboxylase family protein [bacterium]HRS05877.1 uroporphyrinogen decarboxylase family protein [Candidatus Ratteibacteria bacterium]HON05056.1 uroporphyrinogen decarboxylase family protein [bacterium]HOQ82569.1 uroporphyrinogen decarboxylase family protein [bacterium]